MFPKLFWPTVRKNCSTDWGKTFEIWGWRPRICRNFEITRTMKQWKVSTMFETECFYNLFLEISQIWIIRKIRIQIGKNNLDSETYWKSLKNMNPCQLYWGVWWETNHNTELISHDSFSVCFFLFVIFKISSVQKIWIQTNRLTKKLTRIKYKLHR